jgi:hypothetical protein
MWSHSCEIQTKRLDRPTAVRFEEITQSARTLLKASCGCSWSSRTEMFDTKCDRRSLVELALASSPGSLLLPPPPPLLLLLLRHTPAGGDGDVIAVRFSCFNGHWFGGVGRTAISGRMYTTARSNIIKVSYIMSGDRYESIEIGRRWFLPT